MKLYGYWRSSSAWRARIALLYKGLAFENHPVHLVRDGGEQHGAGYRAVNPMEEVPTLELEEAGRTRQLAEIVNSGIQPLQNRMVLERVKGSGVDEQAWARHFIARGLAGLEGVATETAGAFLVGDAATAADVYLIPQLYNARRFTVDLAPYPTLLRAEQSCLKIAAFTDSHPDRQPDAEV